MDLPGDNFSAVDTHLSIARSLSSSRSSCGSPQPENTTHEVEKGRRGSVTLSQIERTSPITAKAEAWDFNDLACCSIVKISLISANVTTPMELAADALRAELGEEPDNDVLMAESNRLVFDIRTNDYTAAAIVDGNVGLGDDALYGRDVMPPEDRSIH